MVRCGECEYARSFPFAIFITLYKSTAYAHCNFQMKYALLEYKNYLFNLVVCNKYGIFVMWETTPQCEWHALYSTKKENNDIDYWTGFNRNFIAHYSLMVYSIYYNTNCTLLVLPLVYTI